MDNSPTKMSFSMAAGAATTVAVSAAYIPIRDDSGLRSLSVNERDFLCQAAAANNNNNNRNNNNNSIAWRGDGRTCHQVRQIKFASMGRWEDGAECTVQWGMTRVTCLVSSNIVTPSLDRPNEGMLYFSVDLSPMASTSFGHAQPATTVPRGSSGSSHMASALPPLNDTHQKLLSNRILRTLERVVLTSGVMDLEALCIVSGQWVWKLHVSVTVLDMGGNVLDASVLSCMAALSHYRQPQVSLGTTTNTTSSPTLISPDFQQATPLPLHHIPLTISFGLLPVSPEASGGSSSSTSTPSKHRSTTSSSVVAWMDPTDREELVTTGTLTMAMNVHGEVCWLDVNGCELAPSKLRECGQMAQSAIAKLCGFLEESLKDAEEQAQRDRLQRLQRQQQHQLEPTTTITDPTKLPPLPPPSNVQVPFWQGISEVDVGLEAAAAVAARDDTTVVSLQKLQLFQQEEEYRNMALDYAQGHVAAKVKENRSEQDQAAAAKSKSATSSSSLLAALLKSAAAQQQQQPAPEQHPSLPTSTEGASAALAKGDASTHSSIATELVTQTITFQKSPPKNTAKVDRNDDDEDDEEEEVTTMLWQSEFSSVASTPNKNTVAVVVEESQTATTTTTTNTTRTTSEPMVIVQAVDPPKDEPKIEEDDIDDLAMAIKKKKKKKTKK